MRQSSLTLNFYVCSLHEFLLHLQFLLLMYLVTYLGALCNGLTLLIIGMAKSLSLSLFIDIEKYFKTARII